MSSYFVPIKYPLVKSYDLRMKVACVFIQNIFTTSYSIFKMRVSRSKAFFKSSPDGELLKNSVLIKSSNLKKKNRNKHHQLIILKSSHG